MSISLQSASAGWGGRILGAMSSNKKIHYVGTDPNTDNFIDELGISRYKYLADFYNDTCTNDYTDTALNFFEPVEQPNTFEVFMDGSELIGNNPDFQKYKGKLDFVLHLRHTLTESNTQQMKHNHLKRMVSTRTGERIFYFQH